MDRGTNFDKTNLQELIPSFNYSKEKGCFDKVNFQWNIGIVEDRLFDTGSDNDIVSKTDVLLA